MSGPIKPSMAERIGGGIRQTASNDACVAAASRHAADIGRQQVFIAPALLTDDQAAALWGVSVRRFHELRSEPWSPAPIILGPRQLRWARSELEAAIASMPRADKRSEPAQLARARIDRLKACGVPA